MDVIYLNLLDLQARDHEVTVITLVRSDAEKQHIAALEAHCEHAIVVEPRNARSLLFKVWYRILFSFLSLIQWRPRCSFYGAPPELRDEVKKLLAAKHFDLVEIHHSTSGSLRDDIGHVPCALYLYDLHFRAKARATALSRGVAAILGRILVSQFRCYETRLLPCFDLLLLGQEQDKIEVERIVGAGRHVALMPNVIDTDSVRPDHSVHVQEKSIVFVGAMTHHANVDAILHFADAIWPLIRKAEPKAEWWIVGGKPPPEITALDGDRGVRVYADVPDVRPYIARAAVYIAPLRIGSGVKVKIMEALAMGKAIVATPVAAEGMGLTDGQDLRIVDSDQAFAMAVVALWNDPRGRVALETKARESAVNLFSFSAGGATLSETYSDLRVYTR